MVNRVRKAAEEHMPKSETLPDVGDIPSVLTTTHEGEFLILCPFLAVETMRNYDGHRNCSTQCHQAAQPSC